MIKQIGYFFAVLVVLFFTVPAAATEIKIIDSMGLIRAIKKYNSKNQLTVVVKDSNGSFPANIRISNLDGLAQEQTLPHTGNGRYVYKNLPPGTWKIILPDKSLSLQEVKIND